MKRQLTVAIVGTGFLARTRARCWRKVHGTDVTLVVAARDCDDPAAFAREHGAHRATSIDAALADPGVDLVDLCVPNHVHAPLCLRAAAASKHVLCTKPLTAFWGQGLPSGASAAEVAATDRATMLRAAVADAQAMVDACAAAGVQLFYGENWIFAPAVQRAAALGAAAPGVVLEMRGWESHSGSHASYARDWRHAGGGALLRLGAHPIGTMLWLKRREGQRRRGTPVRVVAVTGEVADLSRAAAGAACEVASGWGDVENWGTCVLHFDDGTRGVAYGSDNLLGGMQSHLSIHASDHRLECALSPMDALRAYAVREGAFGQEYLMEKLAGQAGWTTPMPDEDWSSGHQGLAQSVADHLAAGTRSDVDGELGLEVVRVIYSAYVSAAEGRRVLVSG
ncbi:MAG: Gfo/Idh/MocA family oxidoreductase [Planctomycetes bacterium]|nr:Gfo/Idh/MocA family oxidoreductase [Planctomycetota bacterium]